MRRRYIWLSWSVASSLPLLNSNLSSSENSLLESSEEQTITGDIERDLADVRNL